MATLPTGPGYGRALRQAQAGSALRGAMAGIEKGHTLGMQERRMRMQEAAARRAAELQQVAMANEAAKLTGELRGEGDVLALLAQQEAAAAGAGGGSRSRRGGGQAAAGPGSFGVRDLAAKLHGTAVAEDEAQAVLDALAAAKAAQAAQAPEAAQIAAEAGLETPMIPDEAMRFRGDRRDRYLRSMASSAQAKEEKDFSEIRQIPGGVGKSAEHDQLMAALGLDERRFAAADRDTFVPMTDLDVATPPPVGIGSSDRRSVELLQRQLNERGFPVQVDGSFGPGTRDAVASYQESVGISPSGKVDDATWATLIKAPGSTGLERPPHMVRYLDEGPIPDTTRELERYGLRNVPADRLGLPGSTVMSAPAMSKLASLVDQGHPMARTLAKAFGIDPDVDMEGLGADTSEYTYQLARELQSRQKPEAEARLNDALVRQRLIQMDPNLLETIGQVEYDKVVSALMEMDPKDQSYALQDLGTMTAHQRAMELKRIVKKSKIDYGGTGGGRGGISEAHRAWARSVDREEKLRDDISSARGDMASLEQRLGSDAAGTQAYKQAAADIAIWQLELYGDGKTEWTGSERNAPARDKTMYLDDLRRGLRTPSRRTSTDKGGGGRGGGRGGDRGGVGLSGEQVRSLLAEAKTDEDRKEVMGLNRPPDEWAAFGVGQNGEKLGDKRSRTKASPDISVGDAKAAFEEAKVVDPKAMITLKGRREAKALRAAARRELSEAREREAGDSERELVRARFIGPHSSAVSAATDVINEGGTREEAVRALANLKSVMNSLRRAEQDPGELISRSGGLRDVWSRHSTTTYDSATGNDIYLIKALEEMAGVSPSFQGPPPEAPRRHYRPGGRVIVE